jgi:hypothetical protein
MKHRFLLHSLSHTFVVVDITEIGLPTEAYPPEGKEQIVPSLRFQSWTAAERYFLSLGAGAEVLQGTLSALKRQSVAVMTIV